MEMWRDIPGYEGLYEASTEGVIRTREGKTTSSSRFQHRVWKQRILKQKVQRRKSGNRGDARVSLWKNGIERTHLVSRLVALTWCDGYSEGMTVNHIDGNPSNNNAENLEWVSRAENIRLAFEDGLYRGKRVMLVAPCGKEHRFRSIAEAGRFLGRSHSYIYGLIKRGVNVTQEGYRIEVEAG